MSCVCLWGGGRVDALKFPGIKTLSPGIFKVSYDSGFKLIHPGAAVCDRPLQHIEVSVLLCVIARPPVPRTAVRARPLKHLEVPMHRRRSARPLVPRAAVRARPLQHLEVPARRRVLARRLVPRASVLARPLQHLEMSALCHILARPFAPWEVISAQPLQYFELSFLRREGAQASSIRVEGDEFLVTSFSQDTSLMQELQPA